MNILRALGRPFLALPFVLSGVEALARPAGHRERAEMMAPLANTLGVPLEERHYDMATRALGATTAVAGLALAFGKAPRFAALALAGVQVPIMAANNPFWRYRGEERREAMAGMVGGLGLLGGVMIAAADRAGKPSHAYRVASRNELQTKVHEARAEIEAQYRKKLAGAS